MVAADGPIEEESILVDLQKEQDENVEGVHHEIGLADVIPKSNQTLLHFFAILRRFLGRLQKLLPHRITIRNNKQEYT